MFDFFIADLHLDHFNIIRYCKRPFSTTKEMNEVIINNWNRVVSKDDRVFLLGDFALAPRPRISELAKMLNGEVVLVAGNHDRMSGTAWRNIGWKYNKKPIIYDGFVLSHQPVLNSDTPNIHGHTHAHVGRSPYICVSVECTDYSPVGISYVTEVIRGW